MNEHEWWAQQFEENRSHLRAIAYRILGSASEADDAVQEALVRIDGAAARPGRPRVIRGAKTWAKGAVAFAELAQSAQLMLVDGVMGLVWAPRGRLSRVLGVTIASGKIINVEIIADPEHLRELDLRLLSRVPRSISPD